MTTEEMKALRRVGFQAWNEGRPELFDEVYAPNFRNPFSDETLDVVKQNIRIARVAFPDLTVTVDDQIVEGDRDVVRWTARGLHSGEYLGVPATGRRMEQTGINIGRWENGRIVEEWPIADDVGMLRQLGVLP